MVSSFNSDLLNYAGVLGVITMPDVTTPSHILFDYILSHDKVYEMKVIRMSQLNKDAKPVETVRATFSSLDQNSK
jgi:hypothetical protein